MRLVLARPGLLFRHLGPLVMLAAVCSTSQAAPPANEVFTSEVRTLQTRDGVPLRITYYPSVKGKESPVVVLLHMKDGNRLIWQGKNGFAERLQHEGFAVITVDLRQHGESRPGGGGAGAVLPQGGRKVTGKRGNSGDLRPADYRAMWEIDAETVKNFIYDENQAERLNMNKMGIVGPEMGASIAALFAANDWLKEPHEDGQPGYQTPRGQDVRALVLISPQSSFHGLVMAPAINTLRETSRDVAFLVCVGKHDPQDKGQAKKIFEQAAAFPNSSKRMYRYEYPGKLRGTDLIGNKLGIEEHMVTFFDEHLKKRESPWRDRQSRLERGDKPAK
jgi:pimeloyl-ACP methyl ester carboxylesterase